MYRFGYVAPAKRASQSGASHASELPYVFDTLSAVNTPIDPADQAMATTLGDYWVQFARAGVPAPAVDGVAALYPREPHANGFR
jgi:para-nitrobenzyl esterase